MKKYLVFLLILVLTFPFLSRNASAAEADKLSQITFDGISLDQAFNPGVFNYTASVNSDVQQTIAHPVAQSASSIIRVNGGTVSSGQSSDPISLTKPGVDTPSTTQVLIVVANPDGGERTYTFSISRKNVPSVASLKAVGISSTAAQISWTLPAGATDLSSLQVQRNGIMVDSLPAGANQYTIYGLQANQTYTFQVTAYNRLGQPGLSVTTVYTPGEQTSDKLSALTSNDPLLNSYLTNNFSGYTTTYSFSFPSYTSTPITLTPVSDPASRIMINGQTVASGSPSSSITLVPGQTTTIEIQVVTGSGGAGSKYRIGLYMPASTKNPINNLIVTGATLDKSFDPTKSSYTATVANGVSSLAILPVSESKAIVKINGTIVSNGNSITVPLYVGLNTITVLATGEDNSSKSYTLEITRQNVSSGASLISLSIGDIPLNESFSSARYGYTANVPFDRYALTVVPVANSYSTVKVNGNAVVSGNSSTVNLTAGTNLIRIDVMGPDSSSNTYTINVSRSFSSDRPLLWALALDSLQTSQNGSSVNTSGQPVLFNETFDPARTVYTAAVPYATSQVMMRITPHGSSYAVMNGSIISKGFTEALPLNVGQNTFTVYAYNNSNQTTTYTIYVTRADVNGSTPGSTGTGQNQGGVVSGNNLVFTANPDPIYSEFSPILQEIKSSLEKHGNDKALIFRVGEIGENRGMTNTLNLSKEMSEFLKQKRKPLLIQTESVSLVVEPDNLPAGPVKLTIKKAYETGQSLPKGFQVIIPSIKITIEHDGQPVTSRVSILTNLSPVDADLAMVFLNGEKIKSTTGTSQKDSKRTKDFSITGSADVAIGSMDRRFSDMYGHWASSEVTYMANKMYVNGYEDYTFRPDVPITRSEFVTLIINALLPAQNTAGTGSADFDDVSKSAWYYAAVKTAAELKIVEGANNKFRPDDFISREEIAVIFNRLLNTAHVLTDPKQSEQVLKRFTDTRQISSWAVESFAAAVSNGLITGTSDTTLSPQSYGSRAQTTLMLYRFLKSTKAL
ncbi:cadherin-like beta sandwich domain-containing protein [Paenibacillus sp. 1P03SA]|uniref:cadherin-like beta sandwich domain-containing protein n=1 Tax=Paenibacillus sp. 1P03SA TaxID=3132294 RepID=UPI0039A0850E